MRIIAYVDDPPVQTNLRQALSEHVPLHLCDRPDRLDELLRGADDGEDVVVLIGVRDRIGRPLAPLMRGLRDRHRHLPVIAVMRLSHEDRQELRPTLLAGARDVIFVGLDDPWDTVRRVMLDHVANDGPARILAELAPLVSSEAWPIVECAVQHAASALTVDQFAGLLGMGRRRLTRRVAKLGLPSPLRLITWSRLMLAAHLLADPSRTIGGVALDLRFPSAAVFRRTLRRYAALLPSQIRARTAITIMAREFVREVRGASAR